MTHVFLVYKETGTYCNGTNQEPYNSVSNIFFEMVRYNPSFYETKESNGREEDLSAYDHPALCCGNLDCACETAQECVFAKRCNPKDIPEYVELTFKHTHCPHEHRPFPSTESRANIYTYRQLSHMNIDNFSMDEPLSCGCVAKHICTGLRT